MSCVENSPVSMFGSAGSPYMDTKAKYGDYVFDDP